MPAIPISNVNFTAQGWLDCSFVLCYIGLIAQITGNIFITFAFMEAFEYAETVLKGKKRSKWKKIKPHIFNTSKLLLLIAAAYLSYRSLS
jgi:hypothetical protein